MTSTEVRTPTTEETQLAISDYKRIVERRLKPNLDVACAQRDRILHQLSEVEQMAKALIAIDSTALQPVSTNENRCRDEMGAPLPVLETRVNIGEEFFVRANIYELDKVVVDVGLGVLVEMSRSEARTFVDDRRGVLEASLAIVSNRIAEIQAHLEGVVQCLTELQVTAGMQENEVVT